MTETDSPFPPRKTWRAHPAPRRDGLTVGEILESLDLDRGTDAAVTPWRRTHRATLRTAMELPGLW